MVDRLARMALAVLLAVFLIAFALKLFVSGVAGLLVDDD